MTAEQRRLMWLRERQRGIGGSDAPALILTAEQYKWSRPEDILRSKTEPIITADRPSLAAQVGAELEDFVARKFTEETGMRVRRVSRHFVHPEHPFMVGNIDRKVVGRDWGLECKTTSAFRDRLFTEDSFPLEYFVQIQHYLAVTGWQRWYLAALIGNSRFYVREVPRDDEFIGRVLIPREAAFWEEVLSVRKEHHHEYERNGAGLPWPAKAGPGGGEPGADRSKGDL